MMADIISTQYEYLVHLMNESSGKLKVLRIITNGWIASKTDIKITCNLSNLANRVRITSKVRTAM